LPVCASVDDMSAPAPEAANHDAGQASLQDLINEKLVHSGERERLKQLLRERLVECGWRDELKEQCKRIVKERGFENITTDQLAKEITPVGRATVPVSHPSHECRTPWSLSPFPRSPTLSFKP